MIVHIKFTMKKIKKDDKTKQNKKIAYRILLQ